MLTDKNNSAAQSGPSEETLINDQKIPTISVVVEWSKEHQKLILVEKTFKDQNEVKVIFPSKVMEIEENPEIKERHFAYFGSAFVEEKNPLLAAHQAIKKGGKLVKVVTFIETFHFKDEYGEQEIYLYFGVEEDQEDITKIKGIVPVYLTYDEVLVDPRVTFLTKLCLQRVALRVKNLF